MVKPEGSRTWAKVYPERWSTPRVLGHERELPERAGPQHGDLDMGRSRLGELVDPSATQTRAQVAWDSWSTPRAL